MDERASRLDTLIIEGFDFTPGKSLKEVVIKNVLFHLNVQLHKSDMWHVTRFGADRDDGRPRSLNITFVDVDLKNELLRMKGNLKNPKVVFKEFLTEHQNDVSNQAKLARKNKLISSAWSQNGLIFATSESVPVPTLLHNSDALNVANDRAGGGEHVGHIPANLQLPQLHSSRKLLFGF